MSNQPDARDAQTLAAREQALRRAFPRNAAAFTAFEGIWAAGAGFVLLATAIPSYLVEVKASKTLIQAVMQVIPLLTVLQLWSGTICHGKHRMRRLRLLWLAFPLCWLTFGAVSLAFWGRLPVNVFIGLFVLTCAGLGASMHLYSPAYAGLVLECTPLRWRGRFASARAVIGSLLGLGGAWLSSVLKAGWPGMQEFSYCFLVGASFMAVSCGATLLVRDVAGQDVLSPPPRPIGTALALLKNRSFRVFLVFYAVAVAAGGLAPLIVTYGREILTMAKEEFTAAYCVGSILAFLAAPLADRFGFRLLGVLGTALLAASFATMLVGEAARPAVLLACACAGGGTSLCLMVLANLGSELAPGLSPATVMAVGAVLGLPLSMGVAPLGGRLVDAYAMAGYRVAFACGAGLGVCALAGFLLAVHEPRNGRPLCEVESLKA
jgi:MFS family permease